MKCSLDERPESVRRMEEMFPCPDCEGKVFCGRRVGESDGELERTCPECGREIEYFSEWGSCENMGNPEPGRNEICPCGSGRKFKRCCGKRLDAAAEVE